MKRFLAAWAPVAAWCGLIFWLSSIPDLATGLESRWDLVVRKCAHFGEFAVLATLVWRALESGGRGVPTSFRAALVFSVFYAATDEFHQAFVPGRWPSVWDVALDSSGALAACLLQRRWGRNALAVLAERVRAPRAPVWLAALLLLGGCARLDYLRAGFLERRGRHEKALGLYLRAAERAGKGGLAPRALFAGGKLAGNVLGDHRLARSLFHRIVDEHGDKRDWGRRAERALFDTPNYFPLVINGQWEEGDSDTGGRNAVVKITCRPVAEDPRAVLAVHGYYAGQRFVKELSLNKLYRKADLELQERGKPSEPPLVVLKYPFERGAAWTSRRGRRKVAFRIEGTRTVRVRAGEFKDCLVVREQEEGVPSWQLHYYAPGVGRVLTSLATGSGERRNTELLSYNLSGGHEAGEEPK